MSEHHNIEQEILKSYQDRIRILKESLQETRNELSYTASTLIEERQQHDRTREYANKIEQENLYLKQKIEELQREAEYSHMRTEERTYSSSYSDPYSYTMPPMSPVSVSVSPRIHPQPQPQPQQQQQQYQCSPAMATCDGLFEPSPSHFRTNTQ